MRASRLLLGDYSKGRVTAAAVHQAVCQDIVRHVGSTRASIWYFSPLQDRIVCACLLDIRTGFIEQGAELQEDDFPEYFSAIRDNEIVRASDAVRHPATQCFDELYFMPNGITSLLDVVITTGRRHVAILCCEHCDGVREWNASDEAYLRQMAVVLRLSFLVGQRSSPARISRM
jgi:GAF domain-containing protein